MFIPDNLCNIFLYNTGLEVKRENITIKHYRNFAGIFHIQVV